MQLEKFLKDFTYGSKYEFLDEAKNKSELETIANKRGIKLPAHDLACFKCTYAFVDRENLNGCTLPKSEVEKALDTLIGKAVDFDHLRQRVVGHWIDAKLEKDEIVAYGVFYKGNFADDYVVIKEMMEKDVLAISFEAYGNRQVNASSGKGYNLTDIEFAGGALLIKTTPAFPGSEVMELAKERVLEFAKVMTPPEKYMRTNDGKLYLDNMSTIYDLMYTVECPTCKEKSLGNIKSIDLEGQNMKVECYSCGAIVNIDFNPAAKLIKKGKKPTNVDIMASLEQEGEIDMEKSKSLNEKIKKPFTIKCDSCGYTEESDVRGESAICTKCGGTTTTQGLDKTGVIKSTDMGEEKKMDEKIKELEQEIAKLKEDIASKDESLEKATATIEELKKESEEAKVKIEQIETAKAKEIEQAKVDAIKVTERKSELGEEFSKDIDLLDDTSYELAKSKKMLAEKDAEIAALKESTKVEKPDLDKGSKDKTKKEESKAERVQRFAWNKE
ncbi:MAG: hypothetical protein M0R23_08840 [Bacteroidales bacterium]|nr:hypothetical protein [Bacteroidales bacterium]